MKPLRGSNRVSSNLPDVGTKKKQREERDTQTTDEEENDYHNKSTRLKTARKRKAAEVSASKHKKEAKLNWGAMSGSSITAVENMLDVAILTSLAAKSKDKNECQEHLNTLKKEFLSSCAKLQVPLLKQKPLLLSSQRHQEEVKKSVMGKKMLRVMEKDLKGLINTLKEIEEQTVSLQNSCTILRDKLEGEEEKAQQILQLADQTVLKLSPVASAEDDNTIESRLKKILPDSTHETSARKLGEALQKPAANKQTRALLSTAHKNAERVFKWLQKEDST